MPCRLIQERMDRARPRFGIPDGIPGGEHDAGQHPVADARFAGRRPDDALVVAEGEVAQRVLLPVPVQQVPDPGRVLAAQPACWLGRPEEHVRGRDQREKAERAGQEAEKIPAGLRLELDRAGESEQAVDNGLPPLRQGVVRLEPPDQRDVAQADRDVGQHQPAEHGQGPPAGARIADRVELAPVEDQHGEQPGGHDGPANVRVVREMDHGAGDEQQDHRAAGAALPPAQPVRQHEQQQAGEDVGGAGQVGQRARGQIEDPVQPVVRVQAGHGALDDVGQADQQGQPARDDRHPAPLMPAIRRADRDRRWPAATRHRMWALPGLTRCVQPSRTSWSSPWSRGISVVITEMRRGQTP